LPQLGVVFVLPGAAGCLKGLDLAHAQEFLFGGLGQKGATTALADDGIDFSGEAAGDDNVRPFGGKGHS